MYRNMENDNFDSSKRFIQILIELDSDSRSSFPSE